MNFMQHHCLRQWLYVNIFFYFFQNFFHRHTKNKNTKNNVSEEALSKRRVFSVLIFGVTMEKVLEDVYEDMNFMFQARAVDLCQIKRSGYFCLINGSNPEANLNTV
jgi:hypothetical protein